MKKSLFLVLYVSVFFLAGCQKESEMVEQPGTVTINFDNIALVNGNQQQLSLASIGSKEYPLSNSLGQPFNITLLRYYVSAIELDGPNGEHFIDDVSVSAAESKGYYLVDESKENSQFILLEDIPAGVYNKITFTIGVDSTGVLDGAAGGVLDPALNKMFWNWNSGYVALKFEGQSSASSGGTSGAESIPTGTPNGIVYHVGGWKNIAGTSFVYNNKRLSFAFDTDLKVSADREPEVHLVFDVLKIFNGSKTIDFNGNHNVHKPTDGADMANNMASAFSFDHVHQ